MTRIGRLCCWFVALLASSRALGCAVCFGASDSPLAKGMNMGILSLLVVVLGVLTGVGALFIMLGRRAAAAARIRRLLESAGADAEVATCGFVPAGAVEVASTIERQDTKLSPTMSR